MGFKEYIVAVKGFINMTKLEFKKIRLNQCTDGHDFRHREDCQHWIQQFLSYITTRLGNQITVKVDTYCAGHVQFCMDLYNEENSSFMTTIALSLGVICLYPPIEDQLDIVLPSIIDVFYLIRLILRVPRGISFLEISLPDKLSAAQHVQVK